MGIGLPRVQPLTRFAHALGPWIRSPDGDSYRLLHYLLSHGFQVILLLEAAVVSQVSCYEPRLLF